MKKREKTIIIKIFFVARYYNSKFVLCFCCVHYFLFYLLVCVHTYHSVVFSKYIYYFMMLSVDTLAKQCVSYVVNNITSDSLKFPHIPPEVCQVMNITEYNKESLLFLFIE